ncbi:MAG: C1 family peptidase [Eubacteriaceae bacterium]|nr:C1 family peptidase [Eubacteriaceae bacterium]
MDNGKSVSIGKSAQLIDAFKKNKTNMALRTAVSQSMLAESSFDISLAGNSTYNFDIDIPTSSPRNQKQTGRCWLFASLNMMRQKIESKLNVSKIELSESYLAFWDKFERVNYTLESIMDTAGLPLTDRIVAFLLKGGISDGGQWDMMAALVEKYGIVPASAMPETTIAGNTRLLNRLINSKIREYAIELRELASAGKVEEANSRKEEMLGEVFNALCICYGVPPVSFDFAYTDKKKKYYVDRGVTPQGFFEKYVGINMQDYASIINSPTPDKPYYKRFTVRYIGNVVGTQISYINVPMDAFKEMVLAQLQDNDPVWFGCDSNHYSDDKTGIYSIEAFKFGDILGGIKFGMSKGERLDLLDSAMNHAMLLTGVAFSSDGSVEKWKIENSWGTDSGSKGFYLATGEWFDNFTYQAVVHKKYLNQQALEALGEDAFPLEPWDPMGTLALAK